MFTQLEMTDSKLQTVILRIFDIAKIKIQTCNIRNRFRMDFAILMAKEIYSDAHVDFFIQLTYLIFT